MAKKFLSPLNLLNLTADPGTATEGDIYWNSTDNKLRVYYNGAWADASSGSGGVAYVAQTSAPSSTDVLWIDTDEPDVLYTAGDGLDSAGLELSVDNTVLRTTTTSLPNVTSVNSTTIPASKTLVVTTDIGSSVQAYDADLDAIAALTGTSGNLTKTGTNTWALDTTSYLSTSTASSTYLPLTGGTISSNLTITGDLTVNGTTTNLNSTNLVIEDKNIILGDVATPSNTTADGGGITLKGATDKTFNWVNATGYWTSNVGIEASSFVKTSGTSSQFLKADGSIDSSTYLTTSSASSTYAALSSANTFTNNQLISANTSGNALEIRQIGAGNALVIEDSANPDSTPFVINANGQVFIGTTTQLPGSLNSGLNIVSDSISAPNSNIVSRRYSTDSAASVLGLGKARGSLASPTIVSSGDSLGAYMALGYDGANFRTGGAIHFDVDGTPGIDSMPTRIRFSTTSNGTSFETERMRIDSAGNVGIGVTSPGKRVDIDGQLRIRNGGTTGYGLLEYGTSATATNNWHVGSEGDGTFRWYNGNFGSGTERMRIDSSGNVGIGKTASTKLDVNGTINGTNVTISGASVTTTGKAIAMAIVFGG